MPRRRLPKAAALLVTAAALLCSLPATPAEAQGIVIDEGRFRVTVGGREAGSEDFTIRRAGVGRDDALFANGVVTLGPSDPQEITPLLRATPPDGIVAGYQVRVVGRDAIDFQLSQVGNRYVAVARSPLGDEDREFPVRQNTRILDQDVAHHYYFLRDVREGDQIHVIVPRQRTHTTLQVVARSEGEIQLGGRTVAARRIEFRLGDETRTAWFDRLGRVVRVEVPAARYVAERVDLVG